MKKTLKLIFIILMVFSLSLSSSASHIVNALTSENINNEENIDDSQIKEQETQEEIEMDASSEDVAINEKQSEKALIGVTSYVDEDGNIIEKEVYDGTIPEELTQSSYSRSYKEAVNFNFNGNQVVNYTNALTGESGNLSAAHGADAAYLGMSGSQVKFMLSGVVGLVDSSKVQIFNNDEQFYMSYYTSSGDSFYHRITTNVMDPSGYYRNYIGKKPSYIVDGKNYLSYDGHYFYTDTLTMLNDYQSGVRTNAINANNPYYNYFQYLSFRAPSNYSANELNSFINPKAQSASKMYNIGSDLITNQNLYGSNALMMMGVAANESGWGKSSIAMAKNNIFGLNAVDSNPGGNAGSFDSISSCVMNFSSSWISNRYANPNSSTYSGAYLGDKGSGANVKYASDQFWGEKNAAMMWAFDNANGNKDYNEYSVGIKNTINSSVSNISVYKDANSNVSLYQTKSSYNYAFTLLSPSNETGYYKILSDSVLSADRNSVSTSSLYDKANMFAHVNANQVNVVSVGKDHDLMNISDVSISNMSKSGYDITVTYTSKNALVQAVFPTWTLKADQDDLLYGEGVINGNTITYRVNSAQHNNELGLYRTHIYLYDNQGNSYKYVMKDTNVIHAAPTIDKVEVKDLDATGYTMKVTYSSEAGISYAQFPTWSEKNGQDDLIWGNDGVINGNTITYRVNTKDHNYEPGNYITHIYVYDINGSSTKHVLSTIIPESAIPKISNVKTTKDATGFTITAEVDAQAGISHVQFPTWTEKNGQDDLTWGNDGVINGNTITYRVNTIDHKSEYGNYITHIYVYDKAGRNVKHVLNTTVDEPAAPKISNVKTTKDATGFTITAEVDAQAGISHVQFPTWTEKNGQDDLTWGNDGVINGNTITYRVNTIDHKSEYGNYITHIYVYDKAGKNVKHILNTTVDEPAAPKISNVKATKDATGFTITAEVDAQAGISHVQFPTWSEKNGQDDLTWGNDGVINGNTITYRVNTIDHKSEYGNYITHIYVYDKAGRNVKHILNTTVDEPAAPKISNVKTTKDATGFTITAEVDAQAGISHVQFPTWSEKNGQDDLTWGNDGVINGNTITYRVNTIDHKSEYGNYITHIYVYDKAGRNVKHILNTTVDEPAAPKISNVKTTKDATGFTITAEVDAQAGISHVQFPTWTEKNGQDDLTWGNDGVINGNTITYRVNTIDHKSEYGNYITHIYVYDKAGRNVKHILNTTVDEPAAPKISNVKTTKDATGFTITAEVDAQAGISHVQFPTWTEKNGQDDLTWGNDGVIKGNTITYRVDIKEHNNEYGNYITHIYVYDKAGKSVQHVLNTTISKVEDIKFNNVTVSDKSYSGFTITAEVEAKAGISHVQFPTWSEKNGQDDLTWGNDGVINGNTITYRVNTKDHNYEPGNYITHIYVYDKAGRNVKHVLNTAVPAPLPPTISNVRVENVTSEGFRLYADFTTQLNVSTVQFPTWTQKNGQDDLIYEEGTITGNQAYVDIKRSEHKYEFGKYTTDVYVYDIANNVSQAYRIEIDVPIANVTDNNPVIYDVAISDLDAFGYTITCSILADGGVSLVKFPTWTMRNDQDDLKWNEISTNQTTVSFRVNIANHNNEYGTYMTHIYAYDKKGRVSEKAMVHYSLQNTTSGQGWKYINGQKFFFNSLGSMVGNAPSKKIIDVSQWQGAVDWESVKNYSDIDGVILRCGWAWDGEDTQFARNVSELNRLGIPYGVYLYTYASNAAEGVMEANHTINLLRKYNVNLSYPIYYDVENWEYTDGSKRAPTDTATWVSIVNSYFATMNYNGYYNVDVYSYRSLLQTRLNHPDILKRVSWVAAYTDELAYNNPYYTGSQLGWQYTNGAVNLPEFIPGAGWVDISCFYTK